MESAKILMTQRKVKRVHGAAAAALLATLAAAGLTGPAQAQSYRWVDENGNVVYSQLPPPGGREATEIAPPPPPAETPEQASQRLQEALQQSADRHEDQELADKKAAKEAATAADAAKRCQAARQNLQNLEQGPATRRYRDSSGEYKRMDEQTWQSKKAEAQATIKKYCN